MINAGKIPQPTKASYEGKKISKNPRRGTAAERFGEEWSAKGKSQTSARKLQKVEKNSKGGGFAVISK